MRLYAGGKTERTSPPPEDTSDANGLAMHASVFTLAAKYPDP
jgi:hypothetical protein